MVERKGIEGEEALLQGLLKFMTGKRLVEGGIRPPGARKKIPDGKPLMIATDVVVERFEVDPESNTAPVLHASRGPISLRSGKTNVILATGAVPATTILLNSIGDKLEGRAGKRLTAHFRS